MAAHSSSLYYNYILSINISFVQFLSYYCFICSSSVSRKAHCVPYNVRKQVSIKKMKTITIWVKIVRRIVDDS